MLFLVDSDVPPELAARFVRGAEAVVEADRAWAAFEVVRSAYWAAEDAANVLDPSAEVQAAYERATLEMNQAYEAWKHATRRM